MALARKGFLEGYKVSEDAMIEDSFGGWPLKDPEGQSQWYAAALSTFGIMWNEDYLEANDLNPPDTWEDLTKPEYFGHIVMCDPAKSGSTTFITIMVVQHFIVEEGWENVETGWQNAWTYWAEVAGNVGLFTESSSSVPNKVAIGEYGIGIVIDYYAWEPLKAGKNIGFNNGGATSISADPAGILKGAPNPNEAQRWMDYLSSKRGQEVVGLHRMPMREDAVATSPVLSAWLDAEDVTVIPDYSRDDHNAMFSVTREMFSFWLVKNHEKAKDAQEKIFECESKGLTSYADYKTAVEHYSMVPESSDTLEKALAVDRETEASNWETWGATNLDAAKDAAQKALDEYEQGLEEEQETKARNRTYTYIGGGIAVIAIAVVAFYYLRRS
jgi:ABC-type Fe3+ transport system substrate-binding protein